MAQVQTSDGVVRNLPDLSAPDSRQRISIDPDAFGAPQARSKQVQGQTLSHIGQDAFAAGDHFAQVQTDDAINGAMEGVNKTLDAYRGLEGRAALDAKAQTQRDIDTAFKNARGGLKISSQQLAFDQAVRAYRERYVDGIISTHAAQQSKIYTAAVNRAAFENTLTNVANVADDDEKVAGFAEDAKVALVQDVHDRFGDSVDPALTDDAVDRAQRAVYKTQIETVAAKDLPRALDLVEKHKDRLGPEYAQLSSRYRTQARDIQSVQEADKYLGKMIPPATGPSPYSIGNVKTAAAAGAGTQGYEQPETALDGVVLAANNLRKGFQGLTVAQIGAKWAPPSENNTAAWVQNVSSSSGMKPDQVPNLNDPAQLKSILTGIMVAEKAPAQRALFNDAILTQGVGASLEGKSPKLVKAQIALDEAQTRERISTDYAGDPAMGRAIWQKVSEQYSIAKSAQIATQLQQQDALNRSYRAVGDAIHANPTAPIEPFLQQHPEFTEEQAEHLREVHAKAMQEAMAGGSSDWGRRADEVDARIRSTDPTKRIVNQEQLIPYVRSGDLNQAGWDAMRKKLDDMNKPGAEGDKILQNNFFRQAERSITLESELIPGLKRPGGVESWNKALPVLTKALEDGRAKGLTNQQLMDPENKDSVWGALKPFLPPPQEAKNAKLRDAVVTDAKVAQKAAAVDFDWKTIKTEDQALDAWNAGKLQQGQLNQIIAQHPEWGFAPPAGAPTVSVAQPMAKGQKELGNLDPFNRPTLKNPDGTTSTTSSISIGTDKGEVLIPTVVDGKRLSNAEAIEHYKKTGQHFGIFATPDDADAFAVNLHNMQADKLGLTR